MTELPSVDDLFRLAVRDHQAGKLPQAEILCSQVLAIRRDHPDALHLMGIIAHRLGRTDALALVQRAIAIDPARAEFHRNHGVILKDRGNLDDALTSCRRAVDLEPDSFAANHALATLLCEGQRYDEAIPSLRRAVLADAAQADAWINLGIALSKQTPFDEEALACARRAVALDPASGRARYNLSRLLLLRGDLREGFAEYEARLTIPDRFFHQRFAQPLWDGGSLAGRTLFLIPEQGFGDTLQFVRYVPLVARREPDARIVLGCQRPLDALLRRNFPRYEQVVEGQAPPTFDVYRSLFSLPFLFGTTLETVPAAVPYLAPDPDKARRWRDRLSTDRGRRKVGLAWAGNRHTGHDRVRSMDLYALAPLRTVQETSFYSLQKHERAEQARNPPGFFLMDFTAQLDDFDDTAALVANLDLVVTVDTAVAHLAGALGKPVWVMLPFVDEWRWLLGRDDSPWYPTARLFRQDKPGDWTGVAARVARALADFQPTP